MENGEENPMTDPCLSLGATVWCIMSYSDERVDLTSNKMSVTWKARTGIEADAWEEFLKYAEP